MSKSKQKVKTYTIQVIATVEVNAVLEIETDSERDAIEKAEELLEDNLQVSSCCSIESIEHSIQDFSSEVVEE